MKEIYLIRHAEAPYDSSVPDADRPLSPNGHRQAAALALLLDELGIEEIHSSPYERCLHTIAPLARRLGLAPAALYELRERVFTAAHVGDWATTWKRAWMDPDFAFSDGESGREAQLRMYRAVVAIATATPARTLAIASHGNVIALLLDHIDNAFMFEHACAIRNPDVLRVIFDGKTLRWDNAFTLAELEAFATAFKDGASALNRRRRRPA